MIAVHRVLDSASGTQVPPGLCALAVMTKVPQAGKVKTRLTPPLIPEEAASLNRCFLRDTATAISGAVSDGAARGIAVYTPVGAETAYTDILPAHFELIPQRGDAFGERLFLAGTDLLAVGFHSVCLIDSDSPTVPQSAYSDAARLLAGSGDRVVLGPSDDGGYYLVGFKKVHRRIFDDIDWSTDQVFKQTLERCSEIGVPVELLPAWYDVDDRATLRRLCHELLGAAEMPRGYAAPETHGFLASIVAREGRERIWPDGVSKNESA